MIIGILILGISVALIHSTYKWNKEKKNSQRLVDIIKFMEPKSVLKIKEVLRTRTELLDLDDKRSEYTLTEFLTEDIISGEKIEIILDVTYYKIGDYIIQTKGGFALKLENNTVSSDENLVIEKISKCSGLNDGKMIIPYFDFGPNCRLNSYYNDSGELVRCEDSYDINFILSDDVSYMRNDYNLHKIKLIKLGHEVELFRFKNSTKFEVIKKRKVRNKKQYNIYLKEK